MSIRNVQVIPATFAGEISGWRVTAQFSSSKFSAWENTYHKAIFQDKNRAEKLKDRVESSVQIQSEHWSADEREGTYLVHDRLTVHPIKASAGTEWDVKVGEKKIGTIKYSFSWRSYRFVPAGAMLGGAKHSTLSQAISSIKVD